MNIQEFIKAKEEEFEKDFEFLYGEDDPTHTFHDHDDYLIIRDNIKHFLSKSLLEYNEKIKEMTIETAEQWFTINPKYRTKKRLLDDIITKLTQDTNPKE